MKRILRRSPIVLLLAFQICWPQAAMSQQRKHQKFLNHKTTVITTLNDTIRGNLKVLDDMGMSVLTNPWEQEKNADVERLAYNNIHKVIFFKKENIAIGICAGVVAGTLLGAIIDRPAPLPPRQPNLNASLSYLISDIQAAQRSRAAETPKIGGVVMGAVGGAVVGAIVGGFMRKKFIIGGKKDKWIRLQQKHLRMIH
jgi:hypothetical protein